MERGLAFGSVDSGEQLIVEERAQLIAQPEVDGALREGCAGDTGGLNRNEGQAISR